MSIQFKKATKSKARLRMALIGPPGSGKTFTALSVASGLGERIAVIDTEHGSASKYADRFDFDVVDLETFSPMTYVEAIKAAEREGYDVIVIDSLSHAWMGKGGALEMVDANSAKGGSFGAWRSVTPKHNELVEAIIASKAHVIATMRSKTEYLVEKDGKNTRVTKVGLAPVQRDGVEFEFDVVGDMHEAAFSVSKSRCPSITGRSYQHPGKELAEELRAWLSDGVAPSEPVRVPDAYAPYVAEVKAKLRQAVADHSDDAIRILSAEAAQRLKGADEAVLADVRQAFTDARDDIALARRALEAS